jgi:hypothetical protein
MYALGILLFISKITGALTAHLAIGLHCIAICLCFMLYVCISAFLPYGFYGTVSFSNFLAPELSIGVKYSSHPCMCVDVIRREGPQSPLGLIKQIVL